MSSTDDKWDGEDRRINPPMKMYGGRRNDDRIHPWRWTALTIWIIAFSVVISIGMSKLKDQTDELQNNKAQITSLQKTNCALVNFLLVARKARWDSYKNATAAAKKAKNPDAKKSLEQQAKTNLNAVIGYENLTKPFLFSVGNCRIAKESNIPERPLR